MEHLRIHAAALVLAVLFPTVRLEAQTTHTVNMSGITFTPANLKIDVGDTVDWVWVSGFHNVESGVGGIHDGIFRSGNPVFAPNSFSVTFDQAFLNANAVAGNRYDYFCIVHVGFGMIGSVTVKTPASSTVRNGSGVNPLGFAETSPAVIGGVWNTTVDIVTPGAIASFVAVSPLGPLQINTSLGELLINPAALAGPLSVGAGVHAIPIPGDCNLIGTALSTQAATFLPGQIQLQNAIDLVLGV